MFRDNLSKVLRHVDGALGCILIGSDGISVEQVTQDGKDDRLESIAIEFNDVINRMRRVVAQLQVGPISNITIRMANAVVSGTSISDDYMIMLILSPDADSVRASKMLELIAPRIEAEM